jgi:hypothetical protein
MHELTVEQVQHVAGGGTLADLWNDIRQIIREVPDAYRDAVNSMSDMMCTFTGNC